MVEPGIPAIPFDIASVESAHIDALRLLGIIAGDGIENKSEFGVEAAVVSASLVTRDFPVVLQAGIVAKGSSSFNKDGSKLAPVVLWGSSVCSRCSEIFGFFG